MLTSVGSCGVIEICHEWEWAAPNPAASSAAPAAWRSRPRFFRLIPGPEICCCTFYPAPTRNKRKPQESYWRHGRCRRCRDIPRLSNAGQHWYRREFAPPHSFDDVRVGPSPLQANDRPSSTAHASESPRWNFRVWSYDAQQFGTDLYFYTKKDCEDQREHYYPRGAEIDRIGTDRDYAKHTPYCEFNGVH